MNWVSTYTNILESPFCPLNKSFVSKQAIYLYEMPPKQRILASDTYISRHFFAIEYNNSIFIQPHDAI